MIEIWRDFLYPIGFVANFVYGFRFFLQWTQSELARRSHITKTFWRLSLFGNLVMITHTLIQLNWSMCVIQACNGVISWRNLNLMQEKSLHISFRTVCALFFIVIAAITTLFIFQGLFLQDGNITWVRTPKFLSSSQQISWGWHIIGFLGITLFSSRFWIQWWCSETHQKSYLGLSFWWLSFIGALISTLYFFQMRDIVCGVGPTLGLIPYMRNLWLMYRYPEPQTAS